MMIKFSNNRDITCEPYITLLPGICFSQIRNTDTKMKFQMSVPSKKQQSPNFAP